MEFLLGVLGAALLLEGLPLLLFPGKMKEAFLEMAENEDKALRMLGFCIAITGAVLLWFGRR